MTFFRVLLLGLLWSQVSLAQSLFVAERGSYRYDLSDVEAALSPLPFLTLNPEFELEDARYKLTKKREFQLKDWYQRDWYALQELFKLDQASYIDFYGSTSFGEAKRRAFSELSFDRRRFIHRREIPTPREWGGLNHPPIKTLTMPLEFYSERFAPVDEDRSSPLLAPALQERIDRESRSELSFGNQVELLKDRAAFMAKKRLIQSARKEILMSSLVFVCDASTRELVDLLIERHRAGIRVYVLVDGMISRVLKHRQCPALLRRAGVHVIEANDFWNYQGRTIYHTKKLVVDQTQAIAGGQNMLDADNTSRGLDFKNRDVDLSLTGPIVRDMALAFVTDWNHFAPRFKGMPRLDKNEHLSALELERKQGLRGQENYARILADTTTRTQGVCRYVRQSPFEDRHTIGRAYLALLEHTQASLALTNPIMADSRVTRLNRARLPVFELADSFVMYNKLWRALQNLARQGLPMDLVTTNIEMAGNENVAMLNEVIRERMQHDQELLANFDLFKIYASNRFFGKPHYKNLLRDWVPFENVHVWTHVSFMHSKIVHFDRLVASVGSYNIQHNATDHSYEGTVICMDRALNRQVDETLVEDIVNSIPLTFKQ